MNRKTFITVFAVAIALDLLLTPAIGSPVWMPYVSFAALPALFLFAPLGLALGILSVQALVLWLTAGINLGIATLSLGLLLFIEKWFIPRFLHTSTWQSLVVASLGVSVTLVILMSLSTLLTTNTFALGIRSSAVIFMSTVLALGILFIMRKKYA